MTADPLHAAKTAPHDNLEGSTQQPHAWRLEVGAAAAARPAGPASSPPAAWFSLRMSSAAERARSTLATCRSSSPSTACSSHGDCKLLDGPLHKQLVQDTSA